QAGAVGDRAVRGRRVVTERLGHVDDAGAVHLAQVDDLRQAQLGGGARSVLRDGRGVVPHRAAEVPAVVRRSAHAAVPIGEGHSGPSRGDHLTRVYSSAVRAAIRSQEKCATARSRPAFPIAAARAGSPSRALIRSARVAANASGSRGVPSSSWSTGTSSPVTPSATTSGMPPVAVATTAVSQAIAHRFPILMGP